MCLAVSKTKKLGRAGAEPQPFRQRRALHLQFGVGVECPLVLPQFEQDQLAGIGDALEYLELFAAGILPRDLAARLHRLSELGALAGPRVERHDEPNRYGRSFRARIWTNQFHDPPAAASSAPGMQLADRGDQRDGRVQERIPRVIDLHGTGGFTAIGIALVHRIWY